VLPLEDLLPGPGGGRAHHALCWAATAAAYDGPKLRQTSRIGRKGLAEAVRACPLTCSLIRVMSVCRWHRQMLLGRQSNLIA